MNLMVIGFSFSSGVYFPIFLDEFGQSSFKTTFIGSLCSGSAMIVCKFTIVCLLSSKYVHRFFVSTTRVDTSEIDQRFRFLLELGSLGNKHLIVWPRCAHLCPENILSGLIYGSFQAPGLCAVCGLLLFLKLISQALYSKCAAKGYSGVKNALGGKKYTLVKNKFDT